MLKFTNPISNHIFSHSEIIQDLSDKPPSQALQHPEEKVIVSTTKQSEGNVEALLHLESLTVLH